MKRFTKRQAWLYLAKLWDKPCHCNCRRHIHVHPLKGTSGADCLCVAIEDIYIRNRITEDDYYAMSSASYAPNNKDYRWPLNPRGAEARAAFCREQADTLKAKTLETSQA